MFGAQDDVHGCTSVAGGRMPGAMQDVVLDDG